MPESFVAWVDYSAAEQEKMRQAIALFKETETRDELGLGVIRDILADLLFPGTSTIQTRLRYFLIVPWVYGELLNSRRATSANVAQKVRQLELDLIEPLKASGSEGVFGAEAAARTYYGVSAAQVGPEAAARMAAFLPNPKRYGRIRSGPYLDGRTAAVLRYLPDAEIP